MARMWLEMGSRFELYPEDLNTLNNNTDLNIASKETCFTKAAEYARKVINESGAMPLTEKEWFGGDSYTTGFNSVLTNSWVWGSIMTTEDVHSYWLNFAGSMCPEQTFGYGNRNGKDTSLSAKNCSIKYQMQTGEKQLGLLLKMHTKLPELNIELC